MTTKTTSANATQRQSSTANTNQAPAIPNRQGRPILFLQHPIAPQSHSKLVLNDRQQQSHIQNTRHSQRDQPLAVTENSFLNPFIQVPDELVSNRVTTMSQIDTVSFLSAISASLMPPNLADLSYDSEANENKLLNILPPISNLSISSNVIGTNASICAQNFLPQFKTELWPSTGTPTSVCWRKSLHCT